VHTKRLGWRCGHILGNFRIISTVFFFYFCFFGGNWACALQVLHFLTGWFCFCLPRKSEIRERDIWMLYFSAYENPAVRGPPGANQAFGSTSAWLREGQCTRGTAVDPSRKKKISEWFQKSPSTSKLPSRTSLASSTRPKWREQNVDPKRMGYVIQSISLRPSLFRSSNRGPQRRGFGPSTNCRDGGPFQALDGARGNLVGSYHQ
jgi:hypothetical protein